MAVCTIRSAERESGGTPRRRTATAASAASAAAAAAAAAALACLAASICSTESSAEGQASAALPEIRLGGRGSGGRGSGVGARCCAIAG